MIVTLSAVSAFPAEVVFRDDFVAPQAAAGWQFLNENVATRSFTARPGFLRILTERGALTEDSAVPNLFVREMSGDFVLETRIEFDPGAAQQFAGVLIYENEANAGALGLTYVSGERGEFRGLALITTAGSSSGTQPPVVRYDDESVASPNQVWLRLLRSGDQLVAGYSQDGVTFADFGAVTNAFPETVLVGLGAANGDYAECGGECDVSIVADFDFFQISTLNGNGSGEPRLTSLEIDGPAELRGGRGAEYAAIAHFDDESTLDVTEHAEWFVGPTDAATIDRGALETVPVAATRQITVAAVYTTQSAVGDDLVVTGTKLVRVTPGGLGVGGRACGLGLATLIPAIVLPLLVGRFARSSSPIAYRTATRQSSTIPGLMGPG